MALAIVTSDGLVVTFVRDDVPDGWMPPEGCTAVPEDQLPDGWQRVPEPVPESVSPRQLRIWLVTHGISIESVTAAIAAIPDATQREVAQIEWEYSDRYERAHPMLAAVAAAIGLTEAQVDDAFREAANI